jgi:hypothetical protein
LLEHTRKIHQREPEPKPHNQLIINRYFEANLPKATLSGTSLSNKRKQPELIPAVASSSTETVSRPMTTQGRGWSKRMKFTPAIECVTKEKIEEELQEERRKNQLLERELESVRKQHEADKERLLKIIEALAGPSRS